MTRAQRRAAAKQTRSQQRHGNAIANNLALHRNSIEPLTRDLINNMTANYWTHYDALTHGQLTVVGFQTLTEMNAIVHHLARIMFEPAERDHNEELIALANTVILAAIDAANAMEAIGVRSAGRALFIAKQDEKTAILTSLHNLEQLMGVCDRGQFLRAAIKAANEIEAAMRAARKTSEGDLQKQS